MDTASPCHFAFSGSTDVLKPRRTRRRVQAHLTFRQLPLLADPPCSRPPLATPGVSLSPGAEPPLAVISLAWLGGLWQGSGGLRTAISQSWAQIDVDQSGSLSLADLEGYAKQHGLPQEYVASFMEAVLQAARAGAQTNSEPQQAGADADIDSGDASRRSGVTPNTSASQPAWPLPRMPQQQTPLLAALYRWLAPAAAGGGQLTQQPPPPELTFSQFEKFVRSRETALRRAFDMFDRDQDGVISADDLEASLAHIAICCPRSRCVYRCPRTMAHVMLQRTQAVNQSHSSSVDFASFRRFFMLLPQTELAVEYWLKAGTLPLLTEKLSAVHEGEEPGPKAAAWGHLLAGALAGAASRTATAPLETLRLAVMTGALPGGNLLEAASSIVAAQGWRGLYRGNAINVLRSAPQKALDFFAFDGFKRLLSDPSSAAEGGPTGALRTFMAAGLAGATSWALLYPLETVRSRVTAGLVPAGVSLAQVARSLVQREGVGALYRGLGWSLAGIFPEAALCYGLHDLLKHCYRQTHQGQEPGVLPSLGFGVLAAFTGQLVAFPLETVARRLQVYQGPGGLPTMLSSMLREGGPLILYRGVGAATLRLVPMAIVSFGTYELVRSALMAVEEGADAVAADSEYTQVHSYCTPLSATLSTTATLSSCALKPPGSGDMATTTCTGFPDTTPAALLSSSLLPASGISTHHCASLDARLSLCNRRPPVGAAVMCGAAPSTTLPAGTSTPPPAATPSCCVDTPGCQGGASLLCAAQQELQAAAATAPPATSTAAPGDSATTSLSDPASVGPAGPAGVKVASGAGKAGPQSGGKNMVVDGLAATHRRLDVDACIGEGCRPPSGSACFAATRQPMRV